MAELTGAQITARALKDQGVTHVFGLMGIPVYSVAVAVQEAGIRYTGTRHEQAAGFAAQTVGYLSGQISAALVVSGPGMTNAVTALGHAQANCWPMLLLGGSSNLAFQGRGDFQAAPQIDAARPFTKWAAQATDARLLPRLIAAAVRSAISGRPGPAYLDLPADVIEAKVDESEIAWEAKVTEPPRLPAPEDSVAQAIEALRSADNPLLIVGKGCAWARAEDDVREFVERTQIPFLPTPMGKGVVPDDHPLSVAAARTYALQNADLVLLAGARLNWILHFGLPPRFKPGVRVIQIDIEAEEMGTNVPTEVPLIGDAKVVIGQLNTYLDAHPWQPATDSEWTASLRAEVERKKAETAPMLASDEAPMNYYRPLHEIQSALPRDAIIVAEGAKTMDISRQVLENYTPRSRLDAGTWGTMGVGPGQALAAQLVHPGRRVIALEGDAAFGFDPLEVEVAARYNLPITWIVFNNNGIMGRMGPPSEDPEAQLPPGQFAANVRYDRIMEAVGGKGFHCRTPEELRTALQEAFQYEGTSLINVEIDPSAGARRQKFSWIPRA